MSEHKASVFAVFKKLLRERHVDPQQLLDRLRESDREVFLTAAATSWVPIEVVDRITEAAAAVLFAGHSRPLYELGRVQAVTDLTGIYSILLRIVTIDFAMKQAAKIWSTYLRRGTVRCERVADKKAGRVIIAGYPELSQTQLESSAGFVQGLLEVTGAKNVQVKINTVDRNAIAFETSWT